LPDWRCAAAAQTVERLANTRLRKSRNGAFGRRLRLFARRRLNAIGPAQLHPHTSVLPKNRIVRS
jgi:hypothetical protein